MNDEYFVISGASAYNKKYFENSDFKDMPEDIRNEIKEICIKYAEKLNCVFLIKFDKNGNVYFETETEENDFDFDEIGAKLDIDKITKEKKDFLNSLKIWYKVFRTEEGKEIINELKNSRENKSFEY